MHSIRTLFVGSVIAGITALSVPAASMSVPTISAPASVSGGGTITVTGGSAGGAAATTITVFDKDGPVFTTSPTWNGESFELKITAPAYDPNCPNFLSIDVSNGSGSTTADTTIIP